MPDGRDKNREADAPGARAEDGSGAGADEGNGSDRALTGTEDTQVLSPEAASAAQAAAAGTYDTELLLPMANDSTEPADGIEDTMFATTGESVAGHVVVPRARAAPTQNHTRILPVDIGTELGRYVVEYELGAGGMATVFAARDVQLRRRVAIKVLFPHLARRREVVARFQREARAAAALDHENILRVFDVGGGDERIDSAGSPIVEPPYIVMELVQGRSLHEFLQEIDDPPLAEIVACVGAVMCAALAEAHAAGIVHRDVKPANIMVADSGRLALADFGVAHVEDDDSSLVTRAGALLGTPAFMSPEQAAGKPLDARSDIYSLGATLYRLATGHAPFSGPTARVVSALASGEKRPPAMRNPALGSEMARIIERMMSPRADERYASCDELGTVLTDVVQAGGLDAPDKELVAYFADPQGYRGEREPQIARATLERAREAARERAVPRALALSDRVLALMPEDSPEAEAALGLVSSIGDDRRRTRWLLIGLAALVLAAAAWFGWGWVSTWSSRGGADSPERADAAPVDAGMEVRGIDAPRSVPLAIDAAVSSPVDAAGSTIDARRRRPPRGTENPRPPIDAAPRQPADARKVVIDARPPVDAAPALAQITLQIRPWCNVKIDGVDYGRAKRDQVISLPAGTHDIVCSQGDGRPQWQRKVTLSAGERRSFTGSVLVPVRVSVQVELGDRVTINGRAIKNGASLELAPGRYRVQVLDGDKDKGGGWVPVPVVGSCTIRDRPELACYR